MRPVRRLPEQVPELRADAVRRPHGFAAADGVREAPRAVRERAVEVRERAGRARQRGEEVVGVLGVLEVAGRERVALALAELEPREERDRRLALRGERVALRDEGVVRRDDAPVLGLALPQLPGRRGDVRLELRGHGLAPGERVAQRPVVLHEGLGLLHRAPLEVAPQVPPVLRRVALPELAHDLERVVQLRRVEVELERLLDLAPEQVRRGARRPVVDVGLQHGLRAVSLVAARARGPTSRATDASAWVVAVNIPVF